VYFLQVICALNTKNDEGETALARMKQLHEEQLNKVNQEMQIKVDHYRQVNEPQCWKVLLFVINVQNHSL